MNLAALLSVILAGTPHAPADAELAIYVPRLDAAESVMPFFRAAGQHSVMLRPDAWRGELHPLLDVDLTDASACAAAGIDVSGPLTVSTRNELTVSCLTLKDAKKYTALADAHLARLGDLVRKSISGVPTSFATDALGRVQAAYSLKANEVCAFTAGGYSLDKQLPTLATVVTKPAASPVFKGATALPGGAYVLRFRGEQSIAAGLTDTSTLLTAELEARGIDGAGLAAGGPSPYAEVRPRGMAVVRARLSTAGVAQAMATLVHNTPNGGALRQSSEALVPLLTGNVLSVATGVRIKTGLRTYEMRYFAVQFAFVVEVKDAELAKQVLAKVDLKALKFKEGAIDVGLRGNHLYFANSTVARDAVLPLLGDTAKKQVHAVEFSIDPRAVSHGLAQVPLMEAMQSPEAAVLLGVSAELGPLLNHSEEISGSIDATGTRKQRARVTWALTPPPVVDAGIK